MGKTQVGAPVAPTDGNHAQLSNDNSRTDSRGHLLGSLDAETDVALRVADDNNGLEPGPLTGPGLLLDGLDLKLTFTSVTMPVHPNTTDE